MVINSAILAVAGLRIVLVVLYVFIFMWSVLCVVLALFNNRADESLLNGEKYLLYVIVMSLVVLRLQLLLPHCILGYKGAGG